MYNATTQLHCVLQHALLDATIPIYYDESHVNFAPRENTKPNTLDDLSLRSLINTYSVEPDQPLKFTVENQVTTDGLNRGMINRVPFVSSLTPTYYTALTTGDYAINPEVYGPQGRGYVTKQNDYIEIVINNYDGDHHPCKSA